MNLGLMMVLLKGNDINKIFYLDYSKSLEYLRFQREAGLILYPSHPWEGSGLVAVL